MPASKPLYISVPDPCAEDWHSMTQESNGRFCSSCQKTVIDFSRLSDTELYDYFKNLKTIPCGRFHKQQLNTSVVPVKKEKTGG